MMLARLLTAALALVAAGEVGGGEATAQPQTVALRRTDFDPPPSVDSVLLRLRSSGILDEFANLTAYVARGVSRPAYKRAFAAQLAVNTRKVTKR